MEAPMDESKKAILHLLATCDVSYVSKGIRVSFWQPDGTVPSMTFETGEFKVLEDAGLVVYKNNDAIVSAISDGINKTFEHISEAQARTHKIETGDVVIEDLDHNYYCSMYHNLPYLFMVGVSENEIKFNYTSNWIKNKHWDKLTPIRRD